MNVGEAFAEFRTRLAITKTERERASRTHQDIREHLRSRVDSTTDFLTGSYARDTKTKPLHDVDIFFVLSDNQANRDAFDDPAGSLTRIQDVLEEAYLEQRRRGRRSVQLNFGGEEVESYDVVPSI